MVDLQDMSELDQDDNIPDRVAATKKSIWVNVFVDTSLTISQVNACLIAGSQGLIADDIHSLLGLVAPMISDRQ